MKQGFFYKEEEQKRPRRKPKRASGAKRNPATAFDCEACGLFKEVNSPRMEPYGMFRKKFLTQGEGPGREEDEHGEPFYGRVGRDFRPLYKKYGLDMRRDGITINTVCCRATDGGGDNRAPTATEIRCCQPRKVAVYEKYSPSVIFLLGQPAIDSFYGCDPDRKAALSTKNGLLSLAGFRGKVIPDLRLNCWVCHSYHPSYIVRGNEDLRHIFELDFAVFASMVGKPRPNYRLYEDSVDILHEYGDVIAFLDDVWVDPFGFDYETSSFRYHEGIHTVHLISVAMSSRKAVVFPYDFVVDGRPWWSGKQLRTIRKLWIEKLRGDCPKTAHSIKHEEKCSIAVFGTRVNNWDHCTMIGAHVLDESRGTKGLKVQTYLNWGYGYG